jgi:hypothetical protein
MTSYASERRGQSISSTERLLKRYSNRYKTRSHTNICMMIGMEGRAVDFYLMRTKVSFPATRHAQIETLKTTWTIYNMAAVKSLNPKAEVARAAQALQVNISAARGLQDVLRTNLGPKGTMKMY